MTFFKKIIFDNKTISHIESRQVSDTQSDIAFVIHVYYIEIWKELCDYIKKLDRQFDLYITVSKDMNDNNIHKIYNDFPNANIYILENKGRDILPFLQVVNLIDNCSYKYICKLHTKKSLNNENGDVWRKLLYYDLIGSNEIVNNVIEKLESNNVGMVTGKNVILNFTEYDFGNKEKIKALLKIAHLEFDHDFTFAAGSMFWINSDVLQPLVKLFRENYLNFEEENSQTDHTVAHALERFFGLLCKVKEKSIVSTQTDYSKLDKDTLDRLASLAFFQLFRISYLGEEEKKRIVYETINSRWDSKVIMAIKKRLPDKVVFYIKMIMGKK